jgi:ATP-dependent helicase/nuclease subunit B
MAINAPHFIGWSKALAGGVASNLLAGRSEAPVDLGNHRVIVPSSFASRLIQEELAKIASGQVDKLASGQGNELEARRLGGSVDQTNRGTMGVLLPVFQTPTDFLNFGDKNTQAASSADALMAWIEVLQATDRSTLPHLFPIGKQGEFTFEEAKRLAETLFELRDELGGSAQGLDFAGVAALPKNPEKPRWDDLATLEAGYREVLTRRGLKDHNDLRSELARGNDKPEGVTHIWLVGLTDPQPLFITALERLKDHFAIQAIVGADADEAANFDQWGRPLPEAWKDRRSDWKDYSQSVHVTGDAPGALKKLRTLLGDKLPTDGVHAVCACDREVDAPKIAALIHSLGADAVNPLGVAHGSHGLHHALRAWSRCLGGQEPDFEALREALRIPDLVRMTTGGATPVAFTELNEQLDVADRTMLRGGVSEVCAQIASLPKPEDDFRKEADYEAMQKLPARLEALLKLRDEQMALPWQDALVATISLLTVGKKLREDDPDGAFAIEVAETVIETAKEIQAAYEAGETELTHDQLIGLTLDAASTQRHRRSDAQEAVNLPGWVEAPWDPVPHMILFGLNDHLIPRVVHAHPYLPASLRALAGLPTNEAVFASAAFTFEQLWRRRLGHGWLDVIVPQQDADGNPLRPSRLLFQAPDESLGSRVSHLFADAPNSDAQPYWEISDAHKFVPLAEASGAARVLKSISATAFKTYLADPAEFWLKRALRMDEVKHGSIELDAAGFGSLAHGALEIFGNDNLDKAITDPSEIHRQLMACLDKHVHAHFGNDPSTAIRLQVEAARGRLTAFVETQAKMAAEGWVIKAVEGDLPEDDSLGINIIGSFDRLDFNTRTGEWRVYDYKTFNYAKNPASTHTATGHAGEPFIAEVRNRNRKGEDTGEMKLIRWKDLQLPVYHRSLKQGWPGIGKDGILHVGYLCLPSKVSDTGEKVWAHYHTDFMNGAEAQIHRVIEAIKQGGKDAYQPSDDGSEYPILAALNGRRMKEYLNIDQLGGIRK